MKFVVSSSELLSNLQAINKVITTKNTLPILDNFLFELESNELVITASDLETTMVTRLMLDNVESAGSIAIEAKRLTDILKEFPEQPLTFDINTDAFSVDIYSENGKYSVIGQNAEDFPKSQEINSNSVVLDIPVDVLLRGISKTAFATADDELRPIMNGIFVESKENSITFVASDSHKMVRYRRHDVKAAQDSSFILQKKPAALLKNIIAKMDGVVRLRFDSKNARFEVANYTLICRLIEGNYPNYESVIPKINSNKLIIDRGDFATTIRRVAVFSNQASNLVKLALEGNQVTISAQDLDFSISAYEKLSASYDGVDMNIGFKSSFLLELLNNTASHMVVLEMSEPAKAGLIVPFEREMEDEDLLMLIMPMMITA